MLWKCRSLFYLALSHFWWIPKNMRAMIFTLHCPKNTCFKLNHLLKSILTSYMVNGMCTGITPTLPKTNYIKLFKKNLSWCGIFGSVFPHASWEQSEQSVTRGFSPRAFFPRFCVWFFRRFFTISLVDFMPRITFQLIKFIRIQTCNLALSHFWWYAPNFFSFENLYILSSGSFSAILPYFQKRVYFHMCENTRIRPFRSGKTFSLCHNY